MTRDLSDDNHERASAEAFATNMPAAGDDDALEARLTAYVLGELSDGERAAVEAALARSEENRAMVNAIRQSAELMTAALATEPAGSLSANERRQIERRIERSELGIAALAPAARSHARRLAYAAAACLAASVIGFLLWPPVQAAREAGRRSVSVRTPDEGRFSESDRTDENVVSQATEFRGAFNRARGSGVTPARPKAWTDGRRSLDRQPAPPLILKGGKVLYETKTKDMSGGGLKAAASPTDVYDPKPIAELEAQGEARARINREFLFQWKKGGLEVERIPVAAEGETFNREGYERIVDNPFLDVRENPLSTFSIDVDTASYANVRRFLNQGALPPKDAVRIEELVNYFKYHYAPPADDAPFAVHAAIAGCPWKSEHRLLRVALKGREIDFNNRPASNLVFLIDVSGSMDEPNKLPLLKAALRLLIDRLSENDRVAMVVYAGSSGLVLPSTSGERQAMIASALEQLQAGGSTNGGEGIQLAYDTARQNFIRGGTNRVILCTDGDFNVGITDQGSLTRLIEQQAKSGVFLSVLGFGTGNYQDSTMEKLADRGNGNYAYIDNLDEARKTLVEQAGGTLVTIAKDVKLQLEFNPQQVAAYRLIGYENRLLRDEEFNDDTKDAGEIGAGHTVTAFYELVPAGGKTPTASVDPLKYQQQVQPAEAAQSGESLTLKLRYKQPDGAESKLLTHVVKDAGARFSAADNDLQFAAAVAGFGLLLRDSPYQGNLTYAGVLELALAARGSDEEGYRAEFIEVVKKAQAIAGK